MKHNLNIVLISAALFTQIGLFGQPAPPSAPPARPSPAIDLSGYWSPAVNEDGLERGAGSEIGDYAGFAINEAGRLWALSYDPSRLTLKHHQCDGYVAPYQMRAMGNFRIWEDRDPHTMQLVAIHIWAQTTEGFRTIWMDGRPHPPAYAPHTYQGFSTGRFVGDALMVNTTHLKQGWLRRNGLPESDQASMVEFIVRHGDHLVDTTVVTDPVFLTEPEVRSDDFFRQPADHGSWLYACDDGEQIVGRPPDAVPNYPLGAQPFAKEYSKKYKIPLLSGIAGATSIYPEFTAKLKTATDAEAEVLLRPAPGPSPVSRAVDPEPHDGEIYVWPISAHVYHAAWRWREHRGGDGRRGTICGRQRIRPAHRKVIEAIHKLSDKPIQFIVNTSFLPDRTGGNVKLRAAGQDPEPGGFLLLDAVQGRRYGRDNHRPTKRGDPYGGAETTRARLADRHIPQTIAGASITTEMPSRFFTSPTRSQMATASFTFGRRMLSSRAISSTPRNFPSSISRTVAACRAKSTR